MKHKITAAVLALLGAAFLWHAFAQTETPCQAACKAKKEACMKEAAQDPEFRLLALRCQTLYNQCVENCK